MGPKYHAPKKLICQWGNPKENQKIPWEKLKWKHSTPKSTVYAKTFLRGKIIVIWLSQEISKTQINNLTYQI